LAQAPATCSSSATSNLITWTGFTETGTKVFVAAPDGSSRRVVSGPESSPSSVLVPYWIDGGNRIEWTDISSFPYEIVSADPDGRNQIREPTPESDTAYWGGIRMWSPDGRRYLWAAQLKSTAPPGRFYEVFSVDADGGNVVALSSVGPGPLAVNSSDPSWSPDGSRVAWSGSTRPVTNSNDYSSSQIFIAALDGFGRHTVSNVGAGPVVTGSRFPQWSPDGTQIAWYGEVFGVGESILVADADGRNRHIISNVGPGPAPVVNRMPHWSPDGTRIAWTGHAHSSGGPSIYVANDDGTARFDLTSTGVGPRTMFVNFPRWSPDGRFISWQGSNLTSATVMVANVDGANRIGLSDVGPGPTPRNNGRSSWQPLASIVSIRSSVRPLVVGSEATLTLTVEPECLSIGVHVTGLGLPCMSVTSRSVTRGTIAEDGSWDIPLLDATATARIRGTVISSGRCDGVAAASVLRPGPRPMKVVPTGGESATRGNCPTTSPPFTDTNNTFATNDIACIWGLGITNGNTPTTYNPNANVTRAQMAAFIARTWRALGNSCPTTSPPFTDTNNTFATNDIACIWGLGITNGNTPTTYNPNANVTRAQMAAFIARAIRAA